MNIEDKNVLEDSLESIILEATRKASNKINFVDSMESNESKTRAEVISSLLDSASKALAILIMSRELE